MEQHSDQGGAKSTTRTFSFRLGGGAYFWKKEVRSPILLGFGQGYLALLSFTGQQYKNICFGSLFPIKSSIFAVPLQKGIFNV